MEYMFKRKLGLLLPIMILITGCTALDIKPWSSEEIIDGVISSVISGRETSHGNKARCNHYKMIGGSSYREWIKDGKIACSYKS